MHAYTKMQSVPKSGTFQPKTGWDKWSCAPHPFIHSTSDDFNLCHPVWAKIGEKETRFLVRGQIFGRYGKETLRGMGSPGAISFRDVLCNYPHLLPTTPSFQQPLIDKLTDKQRGSQPIFFLSKSVTVSHSSFTAVLLRPESWPHACNQLGGSWPHLTLIPAWYPHW